MIDWINHHHRPVPRVRIVPEDPRPDGRMPWRWLIGMSVLAAVLIITAGRMGR